MEGPDFSQETIRQAQLLADTDAGKRLKALLSQGNAQGLKKATEQLLAQLREKP